MKNKALSLFVCLIAAATLSTQHVDAAGTKDYILGRPMTQDEIEAQQELEPETNGAVPADIRLPEDKTTAISPSKGVYPSSYDLRSTGKMTPVRDQSPYGTCWCFSAMASAESNLLYRGVTTDLSELQLIYYAYHELPSFMTSLAGDYIQPVGDNFLEIGGNSFVTTFALSRWTGATDETVLPYSSASTKMTLDDSYAVSKDTYQLQNCSWTPSQDRDGIKNILMTQGAMAISYYFDDRYQNYSTGGYYCAAQRDINHAVTIAGWDDNYSRENFGGISEKGSKPSADGAWLIKNSYGADWEDGGYFWLSYEDASIVNEYAFSFQLEKAGAYDDIYQYDGGGSLQEIMLDRSDDEKTSYMANVYTASDAQKIQAVSFYTWEANVNYSVQIYTGMEEGPVSAYKELDKEQTGSFNYGGYHTVKLSNPVGVDKGQKFSVVIRLETNEGYPTILADTQESWGWLSMNSSAKSGQSYTSPEGEGWDDISEDGMTNVRVKAFTTKAKSFAAAEVSGISDTKYSGSAICPVPVVKMAEKTLKSGTDYTVTYMNNKNPGMATVLVRGAGIYAGTKRISFKIQPAATQITGITGKAKKITLKWKKTAGVSGYEIYMAGTKKGTYKKVGTVQGNTKFSYTQTGLASAGNFYFKVRAYGETDGQKVYSAFSPVKVTSTSAAVPQLSGLTSGGAGSVNIRIRRTTGANGYAVYMATKKNGTYTLAATLAGIGNTTYTGTGLVRGKTYYFKVASYRNGGDGARVYSAKSAAKGVTVS